MSSQRLNPATASLLPDHVRRPAAAVMDAGVGIVHLGPGAFHRAHQAVYTQAAMEKAGGAWGIVAIALRSDRARRALHPQGGLYTLRRRDADRDEWSLQGAIKDVVAAAGSTRLSQQLFADPRVRVATLTVTEAGYALRADGQSLDMADADVFHDLETPDEPRSVPGWIAAGLRRRRKADAPLTVFSCDNRRANGDALAIAIRDFLAATDRETLTWVEDNVAFPNSMVDRIVPAVRSSDLDVAERSLGMRDEASTVCEPFSEWIIEQRFATEVPAWQEAGATLVDDVAPWEEMKLRLLNGAHTSLVYAANALDIDYVFEAMAHPVLGRYLDTLLKKEIRPHVIAPMGIDLNERIDVISRRFRNPHLGHLCAQIATDGSLKIRERLVPVAELAALSGRPMPLLKAALGCWLQHLRRHAEPRATALNDARADAVLDAVRGWSPSENPTADQAVIEQLLSPLLARKESWVRDVATATRNLAVRGVEAVLEDALARSA